MANNGPIAGEFEIRTTFDPATRDEQNQSVAKRNEELKSSGKQFRLHNDDQLLVCRWAFDSDREMTEMLNGSKNVHRATFYWDREGSCEQGATSSYNIDKPKRVTIWRPAAFYFCSSTMERWTDMLPSYSERALAQPPDGSPGGTVVLVARRPKSKLEFRILVERETGVLHGFDGLADGKLTWRVIVQEFSRGPNGRVFPMRALNSIYLPKSPERPFRTDQLTARAITFPDSQPETSRAFALTLPKGTLVADRLLNRAMTLEQPTDVQTLIRGPMPTAKPFDEVEVMPQPRPTRSWRLWYWIAGAAFAILSAASFLLFVRRRNKA
jgi:hypothetical protein